MMPASTLVDLASTPETPALKLPHPYYTTYSLYASPQSTSAHKRFQIKPTQSGSSTGQPPPEPLDSPHLHFGELLALDSSSRPPESNNSPWARARRSPATTLAWTNPAAPTIAHCWLVTYILLTARPDLETFRLQLEGAAQGQLARALIDVGLAIAHPPSEPASTNSAVPDHPTELLVLRSNFWQGAGSPFGARPVWAPDARRGARFPLVPTAHTLTVRNEGIPVRAWHPRRAAKPPPGAVLYSRWIPHLREMFAMVALDYTDEEHLGLFHAWQNDPRVSQGWNETGSRAQHREYLRRAHEDPHQLTVLAQFDGVPFAYFEIYWAKEDHLGTYYDAEDFDRGRHSLVGDIRYRGPHRVGAWWSSLMHYLFLDDPRTKFVVGEPKATNSTVLMYDFIHGFSVDKFVDLPHKRSGFMRCSRERFFQLSPLAENPKVVGGTGVLLSPKL